MKRPEIGLLLGMAMGLFAGCSDSVEPGSAPVRLSATMKLVSDSLTVTLRVQNVSDTTQVLEWYPECRDGHPATFAVYRDAALTRLAWKPDDPASCPTVEAQMELAPDASGTIRGLPEGLSRILGDSIDAGRFYVAAHPQGLTVRPKGGSYATPVEAKVPAGAVDL